MAFTIQSVTPVAYDPTVDFKSDSELLRLALDGNLAAASRVCKDACDFLVQCRTTASETGAAIELLTARGVPFSAGFMRLVEWDVWATGDGATEKVWLRQQAMVVGGSTPVLLASTLLIATGSTDQEHSAMLGAGITGPASTLTVGAGVVTINVITTLAEIVNWTVRVKVGKLIPTILGV